MQSSVTQKNNHYTKTPYANWILVFMMVVLLIIPLILVWVYWGEWNLSHQNYLVADSYFARLWTLNPINNQYGFSFNNTQRAYVSWQPFVIPILIWVFNLIIYTITSWLKWTKLNGYNFINGLFLMFYIIIITGLWYPTGDQQSNNKSIIISARVLICALSFFAGFILSLWLVNHVLVNTRLGYLYAGELIEEEISKRDYIKKNVSDLKHDISKRKKKTKVTVKEETKTKK